MNIVMIAYYLLSAFLLVLLAWNFVLEKNKDDAVLLLLVIVPLLLRILRVK